MGKQKQMVLKYAGTVTTKDPRNLKPSSVFKKIC